MKLMNIVYDGEYENVDIVRVPGWVADDIETILRDFNEWLSIPTNRQPFSHKCTDGRMVLSVDTPDFLWWLDNIKIAEEQMTEIVKQHTIFDPNLPTAEF